MAKKNHRSNNRGKNNSVQKSADRRSVLEHHHQELTISSGPLPAPDTFRQYEEVLPGAADRVLAMAERQSEHRQSLERKVVESGVSRSKWGMVLGFIVATLTIGAGTYIILQDKSAVGLSLCITAIGTIVAAFIYGTHKQRQERAQQRQDLENRQLDLPLE